MVATEQVATAMRADSHRPGRVVIFAPSPTLTITLEEHRRGGEIHLHAGGQGVWQARMVHAFGANATLCAAFAGETGRVLRYLIVDEGITLVAVEQEGIGSAYVHDRRQGHRETILETAGDELSRHELDELYGLTLREGMDSDIVLLSGPPVDKVLSADVYRRFASDLRTCSCRVMVDLGGERLDAALQGGVDVVKVSHEELLRDGRIASPDAHSVAVAMREIRDAGAEVVVVTRAEKPLLVLEGDREWQVTPPTMEVVDTSGAGDSFTAAVAASLAAGSSIEEAVVLGAAAGALNVTRHGLGTGDPSTIRRLSELVHIGKIGTGPTTEIRMTPRDLTNLVERG